MQNLADFHFGGPGSTYVDTKEWSWKDPKWADPSQQEEGHEAKCYEALLLMQQPQHAALLIEGRLTPRMRAKLAHAAGGMKENVELSLPDFKNFVPRDAREFNGDQGSVQVLSWCLQRCLAQRSTSLLRTDISRCFRPST